ncbi:DegT/DnrJ/EryC1/StrS family aminotransferase [Lachnospiraceae bacterium LCP25S3_G4]
MEIGSEFWFDNSLKAKTNDQWSSTIPHMVLTSSGRGSLTLLLQKIDPVVKTVLLPAYICQSILVPFETLNYRIMFYALDKNLMPVLDTIDMTQKIGVFFHIGYFGFQTNQNLREIIKKMHENSTIIIEDITHTMFSNIKRMHENDYYFGSIRKWLGIISGGILVSKDHRINDKLPEHTQFIAVREEAMELKSYEMSRGNENKEKRYLTLFNQGEELLEKDFEVYSIDSNSRDRVEFLDIKKLISRRKENFKTLDNNIRQIEWIEPVFSELYEYVCPLFYPIYIKGDRDYVKKKLCEEKIYCPIHWPIPRQVSRYNRVNLKTTFDVYHQILSIPCDQRYKKRDMERIVAVLQEMR